MVFSPPFVAFEPRTSEYSKWYMPTWRIPVKMFAISGKFIPSEVRRRRRHALRGLVLVVQQLGVKIVPFMIKE